jgi:co-chaperonin GroES (HSP10)
MKALKDFIIVKDISGEHKTESGLILGGSDDTLGKGKVLSAGGRIKSIQVGNIIMFLKNQGIKTVIEGQDVVIVKYEHCIAVVKED